MRQCWLYESAIYIYQYCCYDLFVCRKIWFKKLKLSEAEKSERDYYSSLTAEEKLQVVQELREMIGKFGYESRKGLRRVLRVIKQE